MRKVIINLVILVCFAVYFLLWYFTNYQDSETKSLIFKIKSPKRIQWITNSTKRSTESDIIVISFTVCDTRFKETINVVKSVLLFTKRTVKFVIFTDDTFKLNLSETLTKWKELTKNQFEFELHDINFPKANRDVWLTLFRKCAAQRLFYPILLEHIDALIYVDIDTLFLGPVEELWQQFSEFDDNQISALALEHENPEVSWYLRFAKHPYYGKYGLNSGVMLMNLTRMRRFEWVDYVTPIMLKWKQNIPWGDQDIINILFHFHPRAVRVLACRYNYRSDQCDYGDDCRSASDRGVFLVHGTRSNFYKHPVLTAVYNAIAEYQMGTGATQMIITNMNKYINATPPSNCRDRKEAFLKVPTETIKSLYYGEFAQEKQTKRVFT